MHRQGWSLPVARQCEILAAAAHGSSVKDSSFGMLRLSMSCSVTLQRSLHCLGSPCVDHLDQLFGWFVVRQAKQGPMRFSVLQGYDMLDNHTFCMTQTHRILS